MDLKELKQLHLREALDISEYYGRIFSFIDFANVTNWFNHDNQTWNDEPLNEKEMLIIDLVGLKELCDVFSEKTKIYFGEDIKSKPSQKFTDLLRVKFGKRNVVTKDLQRIKHYFVQSDQPAQKLLSFIKQDKDGKNFVEIRKCNFDVEIAVDAFRMLEHYDTFCLFSGDADFVYLNNFLKKRGKKIIIIKAGFILAKLKNSADLVINAQRVKKYISQIKTKT